jgi:hypothetical protein
VAHSGGLADAQGLFAFVVGVVRGLIMAAFVPLILVPFVADQVWAPFVRRGRPLTNMYALFAHRD